VTPDQPERGAVNHPGVDGAPQRQPDRRGTLPGGMAAASSEYAPTVPSPPPLPLKQTWRVPTPPSAVALARRSDPPASADPPASESPSAGRLEAKELMAELAKARAEIAERDRRDRVQLESRGPGPYQPPIERRPSPVPSSAPSKTDAAIGLTVRHLLSKAAPFLLAAAGIGGGITAVAKPSADPAKTDAVLASQEAMRADVALLREQVAGMLKREAARDQYVLCLEEVLDDVGEQVLPAQDRLGSAAPLRAYVKQRCKRLRP
jgi:hypothetical protein